MPLRLDDTIASIATAPGEGAIGIVRLSGPEAAPIARRIFRSSRRAARWQSHRLYHGHIVDPQAGTMVDEVLLAYMRRPRSYTGDDVVEIFGHGGNVGLREILRVAVAQGARAAERGEMTLRAFLAGKIDLAQAEAVVDAVRARTPAALSLAVGQLSGGLSGEVAAIRRSLVDVYARLEATIDFAEDDVPAPPRPELLASLGEAKAKLHALLATARAGRLHREGLHVALIGLPNAGKSSLLNALLRADRAIVTPVAGTTRDVIEETIDLEGVPVVLADTAGILETDDHVGQLGVERSVQAMAGADVVVYVIDRSAPLSEADAMLAGRIASRRACGGGEAAAPPVVVLSKADLPAAVSGADATRLAPGSPVIELSSYTGAGLDDLRRALLVAAMGPAAVIRDTQHGIAVGNVRHQQAIERALESVGDAIHSLENDLAPDFVCIDLRQAIVSLGEITGESVTEDLLTSIFAQFCIGK